MEQITEPICELEDIINDNLCQSDNNVSVCAIDSNKAMVVNTSERLIKIVEPSKNSLTDDLNEKIGEIVESSDTDIFEDSFNNLKTDPEVKSVLKSFDCNEAKNLGITLTETAASAERSNEPHILDLHQESNGNELLNVDGRKELGFLITEENVESTESPKPLMNSHTSQLLKSSSRVRTKMETAIGGEEVAEKHNILRNGGNLTSNVETDTSFKSKSFTKKIHGNCSIEESNQNRVDLDIQVGKSNKSNLNESQAVITNICDSPDLLENRDRKDTAGKMISLENSEEVNIEGDACASAVLLDSQGKQDKVDNTEIPDSSIFGVLEKENDPDRDDPEFQSTCTTKISENIVDLDNNALTCDDVSEITFQNNNKYEKDTHVPKDRSTDLSESILKNGSNADMNLTDCLYTRDVSPESIPTSSSDIDVVLEPELNSFHNSNDDDKCLKSSKKKSASNMRSSPKLSPNLKSKNSDAVKLKACRVNLKKALLSESYTHFKSKPNLTTLKRKLEEMLYESASQEESGLKEIKKMRQERSRAYGNLLKELTRVKNKIKNVK